MTDPTLATLARDFARIPALLESILAELRAQRGAAPAATAAQADAPAPAPAEPEAEPAPARSIADLIQLTAQVVRAGKKPEVAALMRARGISNLNALAPDAVPELWDRVTEIAEGRA
jgi:hypothetical protein